MAWPGLAQWAGAQAGLGPGRRRHVEAPTFGGWQNGLSVLPGFLAGASPLAPHPPSGLKVTPVSPCSAGQ